MDSELGWYPFPKYLQHPDGRTLKEAALVMETKGYIGLSTRLHAMADELLAARVERKADGS